MRTKASDSILEVKDISLKVKDKKILQNLRCSARSGDLLAVMGPTGSGKTTLLNVISGRLKPDSGIVTLNDSDFSKRERRRMAFVQQQDVFFTHLTVWETLYFAARIRLPESLTEKQKRQRMDEIVDALDIRKCLKTVIGDVFVRGISGGEKKRVSIACELLTDPDIMLLDEPTSGLDSSTACSLMQRLKSYAINFNKTIITTIHQPSSQIYHMFNNLLLLVDGHEAYWGPSKDATKYFALLNLVCEPDYNPADFLLEVAKSDEETKQRVISAAQTKRSTANGITSKPGENKLDEIQRKLKEIDAPDLNSDKETHIGVNHTNHTESVGMTRSSSNPEVHIPITELGEETDLRASLIQGLDQIPNGKHSLMPETETVRRRWSTSWWTQYKMLSWRSFKQTKGVLKQGYSIAQNLIVSFVVGIIYWQIEMNLTTVRDMMGLIFFAVAYWTFNPAFECITQFPAEKAVLYKERTSGAYRLSAYYFAKITSELPLTFILPTVMYTSFFWMAGLGGAAEFFLTYLVILLQVLVSQGFGFVLAVLCKDMRLSLTSFVSYSLAAFMIGGFFTQNIPDWLQWAKYFSHMLYPFDVMCIVIFAQMQPAPCNTTSIEQFPQCLSNSTTHIYYEDILHKAGITLPVHCYLATIFILIATLRSIGYVVLRLKRQTIL